MSIYRVLENRGLSPRYSETKNWPKPSMDMIPEDKRPRYKKLNRAVEEYCQSHIGIREAAILASVSANVFRKQIHRCLTLSETGEIFGFFALIKNFSIKGYQRIKTKDSNCKAGLFQKLLDTYPTLEKDLIDMWTGKSEKWGIVTRYCAAYENFVKMLKLLGVRGDEYPFTYDNAGRESLRRFLREVTGNHFEKIVSVHYGMKTDQIDEDIFNYEHNGLVVQPYEIVELDAHRCDGIFYVTIEGPDGVPIELELSRVWLIVLLEYVSSAVLGYKICLGEQPSKNDVAEAINRSIVPDKPMALTIPGLNYSPNAGFPSRDIEECKYRLFDLLKVDNAKAHLAKALHEEIGKKINATILLGKGGSPGGRPKLEKFFDIFEEKGLHRTQTTTGSHPKDPRRNRFGKGKNNIYRFNYVEAEQYFDVELANYNGTPPSGSVRSDPLEHLRNAIRVSDGLIRRVPVEERASWTVTEEWIVVTVRVGVKNGRCPYVQFLGARYKSKKLTVCSSLYHKQIKIKLKKDLRSVEAYKMDGKFISVLYAQGIWGRHKHSLWFRRLYMSLKKNNELSQRESPVVAVTNHLFEKAKKSRKHRNILTKLYKEQYGENLDNSENFILKRREEEIPKKSSSDTTSPNRHRIRIRDKDI